jgi:hypothetical protein
MVGDERGPGKPLPDHRGVTVNTGSMDGSPGGVHRLKPPTNTPRPERFQPRILVSQDSHKTSDTIRLVRSTRNSVHRVCFTPTQANGANQER